MGEGGPFQVTGLGIRFGYRYRFGWQARDLYLNLYLNQIPDGRDLRPENGFPATRHLRLPPAPRECKH